MQRVVAAFVLLLLPWPAHALDITTCGQTVAAGEVGVLQVDISGCEFGVVLMNHAVLEMAGHAISVGNLGVQCLESRCAIHGPGDISGGGVGIWGFYPTGKRVVCDVDIPDTKNGGIQNAQRARVSNVTVRRVGFGSLNPEYSSGVYVDVLLGTNLTAADNAGYGVLGGSKVKLTALIATGNGNAGLTAQGRSLLRDSALTGNDGYESGYDLVAYLRPRVIDTICGRSASPGVTAEEPGPPWGVCAND
jgi:hypothetical protein